MKLYTTFNDSGIIQGLFNDDLIPVPEGKEVFYITPRLRDEIANYPVGKLVKADNLTDTSIEYDDLSLIARIVPVPIDKVKENKIKELKSACGKSITNGFSSACLGEAKMFDCADYDQRNILGLVAKAQLMASGGQTDGLLEWKATGEEECYQWTPQQVIQLGSDMYTHISSNLKKEQQLRKVVKNATTVEEVNAVVWE